MNNLVKGLINLAIFGAGATTGWYVTKRKLEEQYRDIMQEEIESVKEYYKNKKITIDDLETIDDMDIVVLSEDEVEDIQREYSDDPLEGMTPEEVEEAREHHKRVISRASKNINYGAYFDKPSLEELAGRNAIRDNNEEDDYNDSHNDDEEEQDIEDGRVLGEVNHDEPYVIEADQYEEECLHYDKLDLFYYVEDGILLDEEDGIVDNIDLICGWDVFKLIEMQTNAWVRNEKLGADYAMHRVNASYARDVAGVAETPKERELRHLSRKKTLMDGEE